MEKLDVSIPVHSHCIHVPAGKGNRDNFRRQSEIIVVDAGLVFRVCRAYCRVAFVTGSGGVVCYH